MPGKRSAVFAASLSLALIFAGLWIRSYFVADSIGRGSPFTGDRGVAYLRFVVMGSQIGKTIIGRGYVWQGAGADIHEGWNIKHDRPTLPKQQINTPLWS